MKWRQEPGGGLYEAEIDSPGGPIKLVCGNTFGLHEQKWYWCVKWPGGQEARGQAPTIAVCKELCERAGVSFEPFGDGFRKKDGYD